MNTSPLNKPTVTIRQRAVAMAVLGILCMVATHPAMAQALAPVTRTSGIVRDTIVAICLAVMTASWGTAGMKMGFGGATVRDVQGPLIGGTIAGSAAAMAAAFIG